MPEPMPAILVTRASPYTRRSQSAWKFASSGTIGPKPSIPPMS